MSPNHRIEVMLRDPRDRRNAHCVTEAKIGLIVRNGDPKVIGTHEACALARGQQAHRVTTIASLEQNLTPAPPFRRSEAARNPINSEFGHGSLGAVALGSNATEDRAIGPTSLGDHAIRDIAMPIRELAVEVFRSLKAPPLRSRLRQVLHNVTHMPRGRHRRVWEVAKTPTNIRVHRDKPSQHLGADSRRGRVNSRGRLRLQGTNNKQSGAALRDEPSGIEHEHIHRIAQIIQRLQGSSEIRSTMRGEEADDVFQQHEGWSPGAHRLQNVDETPERRRLLAGETKAPPRKRQIRTRKRSRRQLDIGHRTPIDLVDILKIEVMRRVAEVRVVHHALLRVDVVGIRKPPAPSLQPHAHQTDSRKEFGEAWTVSTLPRRVRKFELCTVLNHPFKCYPNRSGNATEKWRYHNTGAHSAY